MGLSRQQRGVPEAFQERYLQALGMLIHIATRQAESKPAEELKARYRKKLEFVMKELGHSPIPLGKWEATILAE